MEKLLAGGESLYKAGLWGINLLYKRKVLRVYSLPVPVISVGNLTWGGTGKTPMVIQLAKNLQARGRRVAVLTRGYGKDEPRLLAERLDPIPVLVGADRVVTGIKAVKQFGADLLLLDDGYQQWRLKKDVEILMVDATHPFGNGFLIPRGSLREPVHAAARADLIVLTRVDLNPDGLQELKSRLRSLNPTAPIFCAHYRPVELARWPKDSAGGPVSFKELKGKTVCTLSGIAGPKQFEASVQALGAKIAFTYRVGDHHPYTTAGMIKLMNRCQRHGIKKIVTTAKDAARFPNLLVKAVGPELRGLEFLVLEVVLEFEPNESELLHRIDSLLVR